MEREPTYQYVPSPELTALSERYRVIEKTELIENGWSPHLADAVLDARDRELSKVVEKMFAEGTQEPTRGLLELLNISPDTQS